MSNVTNVILTASVLEDGPARLRELNTWLGVHNAGLMGSLDFDENGKHHKELHYGCRKVLETEVWVAAFNYLDLAKFLAFLKTMQWREPENVQIFVCQQEDDRYREYGLTNNEKGDDCETSW